MDREFLGKMITLLGMIIVIWALNKANRNRRR